MNPEKTNKVNYLLATLTVKYRNVNFVNYLPRPFNNKIIWREKHKITTLTRHKLQQKKEKKNLIQETHLPKELSCLILIRGKLQLRHKRKETFQRKDQELRS